MLCRWLGVAVVILTLKPNTLKLYGAVRVMGQQGFTIEPAIPQYFKALCRAVQLAGSRAKPYNTQYTKP